MLRWSRPGNVFRIICIPDNEKVIKASTIYLLYLVLFACFVLAPLEGVIEAKGGEGRGFRRKFIVLWFWYSVTPTHSKEPKYHEYH